MKVLTLNIPDELDVDNRQLAMMVAALLYDQGKLSLGQPAKLAGLTKKVFAELLGDNDVSLFNYSPKDLSSDIANA